MVSKAIARFARLSPRKARVVVNLVRGRQAGEALQLLEFTRKAGAPVLKKILESAVANARTQSPGVDLDTLFVETATVDKAPNKHLRRWRPRAMGRATRIQKGLSHITIILGVRSYWVRKSIRTASASASSRPGTPSGSRTRRTRSGCTRTSASSAR